MKKCEELIWTDPDDLLRFDWHLLEIDFLRLGSGPAINRHLWAEEMSTSKETYVIDVNDSDLEMQIDPILHEFAEEFEEVCPTSLLAIALPRWIRKTQSMA